MKAIDSPFTKIINGTTQFVIPASSAITHGMLKHNARSFGVMCSVRHAQAVSAGISLAQLFTSRPATVWLALRAGC